MYEYWNMGYPTYIDVSDNYWTSTHNVEHEVIEG